ncbi:glutamate 5-kinase [Vallitalea guaymasensis]|uniref:Glutamate 5-kinase n=1 Tax=Vallitalea guaymasensis TaxID=1185412 RepID=A0A8J8MFI9_9FIRM|nr:glutamate 5-kinase [Vallitalea guaymasensis]QUH31710.1 glutamate 5-kinase [Vallitalea guaymasensis]
MTVRERLKDKKKVIVKVGSSSLTYEETGEINYFRLERLIREITDLKNMGKDVILVTSGAIAVGTKTMNLPSRPNCLEEKQAVAAVGQANLMMIYQKIFSEYNQNVAQILITKNLIDQPVRRQNAQNTLNALLKMGAIPIVNENDTVATEEIVYGDNDTLSAIVSKLVRADLLILLSDIDGLYEEDPRKNNDAKLITEVSEITDDVQHMAGGAGSVVGTGGMATKIAAAKIATSNGIDMVIANASVDNVIEKIVYGEQVGTLFIAK